MRIKSLALRTAGLKANIETTGHNSLRWAVQAIDANSRLADSLVRHCGERPVLLTDSVYLLTHRWKAEDIPANTHIILWDGINSYVELEAHCPAALQRTDLKFYVVGWLTGVVVADTVHMESLYPCSIPTKTKAWKSVSLTSGAYYAPYWYRLLTSFLTHTRYVKNWYADTQKHRQLIAGKKIVFCGLVTPTAHNIDSFFMGVDCPALKAACLQLCVLSYTSDSHDTEVVLDIILTVLQQQEITDASTMACVYSMLNVMHRLMTLGYLHGMNAELFVNEARNSSRFDPYDSFYYQDNLYLDFGSTRGPDAIYPRTLDLCMTNKRFLSVRFLGAGQPLPVYLNALTCSDFLQICREDARSVLRSSKS